MTTQGQTFNSFPAFKVFIFGLEVTEDVSSCTFSWHDGASPNTAEILLNNPNDKYTTTETDLVALYPDISSKTIEVPVTNQNVNTPNFTPKDGSGQEDEPDSTTTIQFSNEETILSQFKIAAKTFDVNTPKGKVYPRKIDKRQHIDQQSLRSMVDSISGKPSDNSTVSREDRFLSLTGDALRYPFVCGEPIFHSNDAVRIFWRDLDNPTIWYHVFAGFISNHNDSLGADGESTVSFSCEDVTRILRYARVTVNPGQYDVTSLAVESDLIFQTSRQDGGFGGLTLQEIVALMIFGSKQTSTKKPLSQALGVDPRTQKPVNVGGVTTPGYLRIGVNGESSTSVATDGVGCFNFEDSRVFLFGPPADAAEDATDFAGIPTVTLPDLGTYQSFLDHRVYTDDLRSLLAPNSDKKLVEPLLASIVPKGGGSPKVEDVITLMGTHPEFWPVDFGKLYMLLPNSLDGSLSKDIILQDVIDTFANETHFTNRLAQILEYSKRIEFSFYATPKGDLLLEMPLYDFEPTDFGNSTVKFTPAPPSNGNDGVTFPVILAPKVQQRGPYGPRYVFTRQDILQHNVGFNDEHVRTQFQVGYNHARGFVFAGKNDQTWSQPGVVTLKALIPQFGARLETKDPYGYIATPEAATIYANLKLNQLNADAKSAHESIVPRLSVSPNRPLQFLIPTTDALNSPMRRTFIATLRNTTGSITWGSSVDQQVSMNYMRTWDGLLTSDKRRIYTPLGGFASRPLNYSKIFAKRTDKAGDAVPSAKSQASQSTPGTGDNSTGTLSDDQAKLDKVGGAAVAFLKNKKVAAKTTSTFRSKAKNDAITNGILAKLARGEALTPDERGSLARNQSNTSAHDHDSQSNAFAIDIGSDGSTPKEIFDGSVSSFRTNPKTGQIIGVPSPDFLKATHLPEKGTFILFEPERNSIHLEFLRSSVRGSLGESE